MSDPVPGLRVNDANDAPAAERGDFVLYWMVAARRAASNFGLQRAVEWAKALDKPLVVLEALGCRHRWANARLHRFVLEGMADNNRAFAKSRALYHPYVEPEPGAGRGLLNALSERAAVIVTDEYPCFMIPKVVGAVAAGSAVKVEVVDSNGILPMRAVDRSMPTAYAFRRRMQKALPDHLLDRPAKNPLARVRLPVLDALPAAITARWPSAAHRLDTAEQGLPIDHGVGPVDIRGGARAAATAWRRFVADRLDTYVEQRNHPDRDAPSGMSPYLHFGHVSSHDLVDSLLDRGDWSLSRLSEKADGRREGWWGMDASAEALLDQLITWRELGFNFCFYRDDYADFESLPAWALTTLAAHADDVRPHLYALEQFDGAQTHDALWNAAQTQLVREGRIHNYLRMVWGKKILEWSATPRDALATMIELNNRYALDGRDPNSYSGIFWVLGRFDRPWGPERPIFGKVRYMTTANTLRKVRAREYLARYGAPEPPSRRTAKRGAGS